MLVSSRLTLSQVIQHRNFGWSPHNLSFPQSIGTYIFVDPQTPYSSRSHLLHNTTTIYSWQNTFFFNQPLSTMLSKTALALRYFTPKISTALSVVMNNEAFFQYIFIDRLHSIWRLICSIWHFIGTIRYFSCSIRHFIGTIWHFFVNIQHFPGDLTAVLQSLRLTVI